jgi:hypothetical protein
MPTPSHKRRTKRVPTPDRRRALESIYALVIASLMVPAVALALMAGRALAAEPQMPGLNLKPLSDMISTPRRKRCHYQPSRTKSRASVVVAAGR